jgi:hypothetical protein
MLIKEIGAYIWCVETVPLPAMAGPWSTAPIWIVRPRAEMQALTALGILLLLGWVLWLRSTFELHRLHPFFFLSLLIFYLCLTIYLIQNICLSM